MLNLPILQFPNLGSLTVIVIFGRIVSWFLAKWQAALDFYFNEGKVTVNSQKHYLQEQLTRNKISKFQKIL